MLVELKEIEVLDPSGQHVRKVADVVALEDGGDVRLHVCVDQQDVSPSFGNAGREVGGESSFRLSALHGHHRDFDAHSFSLVNSCGVAPFLEQSQKLTVSPSELKSLLASGHVFLGITGFRRKSGFYL